MTTNKTFLLALTGNEALAISESLAYDCEQLDQVIGDADSDKARERYTQQRDAIQSVLERLSLWSDVKRLAVVCDDLRERGLSVTKAETTASAKDMMNKGE